MSGTLSKVTRPDERTRAEPKVASPPECLVDSFWVPMTFLKGYSSQTTLSKGDAAGAPGHLPSSD